MAEDVRRDVAGEARLRRRARNERPTLRCCLAVVEDGQLALPCQAASLQVLQHRFHATHRRRQGAEHEDTGADVGDHCACISAAGGLACHAAIDVQVSGYHVGHAVGGFHAVPCQGAKFLPGLRVAHEVQHRLGQVLRACRGHQHRVVSVLHGVRNTAHRRSNAGQAGGHGLQQDHWQALLAAWQDEGIGGGVEGRRVAALAEEPDVFA